MIEMKQIWNDICVISLKTDTKETKIYIYSEINYFFQLSFFSNLNATSYSIHNRIISFRISYVNKTPVRRIPANICWSSRRVEDVFKTYLEHVFTRLQRNKFSSSSWRHLGRRKIVTLNTSSRRLEDIFKTSWRHVLKTSLRRLGDKQNVYWGYLYVTNLNVYPANLYFTNPYLTNLRRIQNALIRTQLFRYSLILKVKQHLYFKH